MSTKHEKRNRCPRRCRYALSLRRGVTLIELMFSIGILLVGLLGVAALIPLAGFEIGRGLTADRMAAAGRNAVHEFDIRNMRRRNMWAKYDHSLFNLNTTLAFCIDPLGRTFIGDVGSAQFPFTGAGAGAAMQRISLFDRPAGKIMDRELAERVFMARDDLAVDRPNDPTLQPQQLYGTTASQRQYNGSFSWFATLVREALTSDEFLLSIVVLEDRDLQAGGVDEKVLDVNVLSSMGGGEIEVPGQPDITTGDWLMLTSTSKKFRWYRVVNSSQDVDSQGVDFTIVMLEGADIDFSPTAAVLIPGVVGVFEKSIRIEGTSLWDTSQ